MNIDLIHIPEALAPHLPVLQILVPLCMGPLIVMFREKTLAWGLSVMTGFYCLWGAVAMLGQVMATGEPLVYRLGNWDPQIGIVYKVDVANAYILTIVSFVTCIILPYAKESVLKEIPHNKHHYFYAMLLLCFTGLMGIAITGDAFNVFVFLEISSLSGYALIAMGRQPHSLTAAYRYLIMGTIGGTFIMTGIGFLYMTTGSLNMELIATALSEGSLNGKALSSLTTTKAAFAFITVGVSIKLALFPLHMWLPNCYTYAPSVVSAFLSATATKVSFYVLLRAMFTLFGVALASQASMLQLIIIPLAIMAIFVGSVTAIAQRDVKRLLAYSSVAQIGYMALGLGLGNLDSITGGIIHLFNHSVMKGALFLVMGCVFYRIGSTHLDDMKGIGKRMPLTMFAFALGGLALIGIPMTAGFVSKWYLVLGAFDAGLWWLVALILLASLLAVIYVFKVIEVAYFQDPPDGWVKEEAPLALLAPTYALIGLTIVFGIWTDPMLGAAREAAAMFLGGAQ